MIDYASQNYMIFTDQLIGVGHWSNDGPTSHPRIFFEQQEDLNLLIACALMTTGDSKTKLTWLFTKHFLNVGFTFVEAIVSNI